MVKTLTSNLSIDGVIINAVPKRGLIPHNIVRFSAQTPPAELRDPVKDLATGYNDSLKIQDIYEGNLILSNQEGEQDGLLGKLVKPQLLEHLHQKLPTPLDGRDRHQDHLESPSMWRLFDFMPSHIYLHTGISGLPELSVVITNCIEYRTNVTAKDFFIPVLREQEQALRELISQGDVYAHIKEGKRFTEL